MWRFGCWLILYFTKFQILVDEIIDDKENPCPLIHILSMLTPKKIKEFFFDIHLDEKKVIHKDQVFGSLLWNRVRSN